MMWVADEVNRPMRWPSFRGRGVFRVVPLDLLNGLAGPHHSLNGHHAPDFLVRGSGAVPRSHRSVAEVIRIVQPGLVVALGMIRGINCRASRTGFRCSESGGQPQREKWRERHDCNSSFHSFIHGSPNWPEICWRAYRTGARFPERRCFPLGHGGSAVCLAGIAVGS